MIRTKHMMFIVRGPRVYLLLLNVMGDIQSISFLPFYSTHTITMKPQDYCCCTIPVGIYSTLAEQFVLGITAGTRCHTTSYPRLLTWKQRWVSTAPLRPFAAQLSSPGC